MLKSEKLSGKRFLKKNQFSFNGTLSFLLTADEEGDAEYGTKSVVRWLKKNKKKDQNH